MTPANRFNSYAFDPLVAPADVNSKTQFGFDHFNARWNALNPTGKYFQVTGAPPNRAICPG